VASHVSEGVELDVDVQVGEVSERTAWLDVVVFAPFGADVSALASKIRERSLAALGDAGLLPSS